MTLILIFAVAQAVLGYVLSEADHKKLGRTPWGMPSLVWALLWFLSWILGLILYLVAHRAEVRRVAQTPAAALDDAGRFVAPVAPMAATGSDFPAYPRPANGSTSVGPTPVPPTPTPTPVSPTPAAGAAPATGSAPVSGAAPPSWQPDPSGRFHYRWWTGSEWTSHVATNGQMIVDNRPDQRIGPY